MALNLDRRTLEFRLHFAVDHGICASNHELIGRPQTASLGFDKGYPAVPCRRRLPEDNGAQWLTGLTRRSGAAAEQFFGVESLYFLKLL